MNISSVHGIRASPYKSACVTAKHALGGLSKVTALEGGSVLLSESAIKRLIEPAEVASLASAAAGMVTGASYVMDGGWSAR